MSLGNKQITPFHMLKLVRKREMLVNGDRKAYDITKFAFSIGCLPCNLRTTEISLYQNATYRSLIRACSTSCKSGGSSCDSR